MARTEGEERRFRHHPRFASLWLQGAPSAILYEMSRVASRRRVDEEESTASPTGDDNHAIDLGCDGRQVGIRAETSRHCFFTTSYLLVEIRAAHFQVRRLVAWWRITPRQEHAKLALSNISCYLY